MIETTYCTQKDKDNVLCSERYRQHIVFRKIETTYCVQKDIDNVLCSVR